MCEDIVGRSQRISVPTEFGGYRYHSTIGKGSFAIVVLVQRISDEQFFACKVISQQYLIEHKLVESFTREVDTFSQLNHQNITKLVDFLSDEKQVYMVMEYCSHGDLHAFISQHGHLSEPQAKIIFRELVSAVSYLHSKNIAHRDLKLENILLSENMHVKLADFGFCRKVDNDELMSTKCGSPIYTAPEIITQSQYDGRIADMWSLGVILYVLLVGKIPWDTTNETQLFYQITTARYHIPETVSPLASRLIGELMCPQPAMRMSANEVLTHPWVDEHSHEPLGYPGVTLRGPSSYSFSPHLLPMGMPQGIRPSPSHGNDPSNPITIHRNLLKESGRQSVRFLSKRPTPLTRKVPLTERHFDFPNPTPH